MKTPTSTALIGYALSGFFLADFVALLIVREILVISILGIVLIFGAIRFYLGSKNIKGVEFSAKPFRLKIEYYRQSRRNK